MLGDSIDRLVCISPELPSSIVIHLPTPSFGNRPQRSSPVLDRVEHLHISSNQSLTSNSQQAQERLGEESDHYSPSLASERLVLPTCSDGMRDPIPINHENGSSVTKAAEHGLGLPSQPVPPTLSSLEIDRQSLEGAGLSTEVINTSLA